jgi:hypothetical protein
MKTRIGKIESVKFGRVGYQDAFIGIGFTLSGNGWGVCDSKGHWDSELISHSENCAWTEADRDKAYAETTRYICKLLSDAKSESVDGLKGKPVEVTFDGNTLKSWRILTEAL